MSIINKQASLRTNQRGAAAILITMVTMVVISLIVLGFAAVSRREQQQTLNQQLSTQAFYAAESGVNDVVNLAKTVGPLTTAKTSCSDFGGQYASLAGASKLNATDNVSYTCLLVDPNPTELDFSDIGTNSTVIPLRSANGKNLSTVTLTWQSKSASATPLSNCPTAVKSGDLPVATAWQCGYGILRFDIVPTAGSGLTEAGLLSNSATSFVLPTTNAAGNISYAGALNGGTPVHGAATCSNTQCSTTITGLSSSQYYMRVSSVYKDSSLKVTATDSTGTTVGLTGAQLLVDSTGKAQDVLRRIQVHVSSSGSSQNLFPENGLETTGSICKRFSVADGFFENDAPTVDPSDTSSPLCAASAGGPPAAGPNNLNGTIGSDPDPGGNGFTTAGPNWGVNLFVIAAPSNVASCVWSWGDGTTTPRTGSECTPGAQSKAFHEYPHIVACHNYTVVTTFTSQSGAKTKSNPRVSSLPFGTNYNC